MRIRFTLDITRDKKRPGELPEGFEYVLIDDDGNEQPVTQKVGFALPERLDEDDED